MKFFTAEWATGGLSDEDFERRPQQYQQHLAAIRTGLPAVIQTLAESTNLHDGLIQQVVASPARRDLRLLLVCGDLQVGYFDITLHYQGVDWSGLNLDLLETLCNDPTAEVLYDEVGLATGSTFEHSLLFSSYSSLSIRFKELFLNRETRANPADRSLLRVTDRFVLEP